MDSEVIGLAVEEEAKGKHVVLKRDSSKIFCHLIVNH
jgi:hypothetical protein